MSNFLSQITQVEEWKVDFTFVPEGEPTFNNRSIEGAVHSNRC